MADTRTDDRKRTYDRPRIVYSEAITARAVVCAKADTTACGAGPIQS